jgi:serine/threonine protein kinase/tetratricopeptide (TPR) repeat protein
MAAAAPLVGSLRFEMAQDFQLAFEAFFSKGTCTVPDVAGAAPGLALQLHLTIGDVAQTQVEGTVSAVQVIPAGSALVEVALGPAAVDELASLAEQMWAFAVDVNDTTGLSGARPTTPDAGPDHRLEPGHVLDGRFQIEAFVASGGVGDVYRATHVFLKRPVALKLLRRVFANDPDMWARFQREAELVSRLESPHIVRIFDFGRTSDGQPFLAMEYVEGVTVDAMLEGEGPVPPERAVELLDQVCEGLTEAHAMGIIHRDLKPPNIILGRRRDGSIIAKILDFGIARLADGQPSDSSKVTLTGLVVGTPAYLAPEQALAGNVDARTDVYALGCVAYELLTGRPPFRSENIAKVISMQLTETPAPLEQWKPELKNWPALTRVVLTALQKGPEDRFASVDVLRSALRQALQDNRAPPEWASRPPVASAPSYLLAPARQSLVGDHEALPFVVIDVLRAQPKSPAANDAWAAARDTLRWFGGVPDTVDEDGQVWLFDPQRPSAALSAALMVRETVEGIAESMGETGPLVRVVVGCGRATVPASTSVSSDPIQRLRGLSARTPAGAVLASRTLLQRAPYAPIERRESSSVDPELVELVDRVPLPATQAMLVEREACLAAIDKRLTSLAQGVVTPVVLRSQSGAGRTSLLAEIATRARAQTHVVVTAGQSPLVRGRPYSVFAELICQLCSVPLESRDYELSKALTKLKVTPSEREAALVLALGKQTPTPFTPRQAAHSIRAVMAAAAFGRRSVWLFDEVEKLDGLSLELVRELMMRPGVGELVVCVASPELADNRFQGVPAIDVPPLSTQGVQTVVTALTGLSFDSTVVEAIALRSRGLPSLVVDWVAWLWARGGLSAGEPLPAYDDPGLAEERLFGEGPRAVRVLATMALTQDAVDSTFLKKVLPEASNATFQRLVTGRLIRPHGRRWSTSSERLASAALTAVGGMRGRLAGQVGQCLAETTLGLTQPPDMARVAGLLTESGDTVRGISAWKAAAEALIARRVPHETMLALIGWAEALASLGSAVEIAKARVELLARAAAFALLHNDAEKARLALDAASATAQQHQIISAEHFLSAARVLRSEAKRARAADALKQALHLSDGSPVEALVLAEVAEVREAEGDTAAAVEGYLLALSKADGAASLAKWHGEIDFRARLESRLGAAYLGLKDVPNARASLTTSISWWRAAQAPGVEARVWANLGALHAQTKEHDEALRNYEAAAAAAAKAGDLLFQAKQLLNLCKVLQRAGDQQALRQRAELTRTLCVHIGWDDGRRSAEGLLRPA